MRLLTALLVAATLVLAACGSSDDGGGSTSAPAPAASDAAPAAARAKVTIKDFEYTPKTITVKAGAKVTWTNEDSAPHTATADGGFDTDTLQKGESKTVTIAKAGTYEYICSFHPYMKGTVVAK